MSSSDNDASTLAPAHQDVEKPYEKEDGSSPAAPNKTEAEDTVHDFPEGGARAWMVAAGTGGILFCTLGYTNSFGVFQTYYMANQLADKSPDDIAWIGSIQGFLIFAAGSIGGPLFDRFGAKVIRPAAILYVFAVMMTSLCKEYWQFMLAQGVLTGIADGLLMFPSLSATPQYFHKKRGAAMGIALAGSSLGGVVFPVILSKMLIDSNISFGWSVRICGFVILPILALSAAGVKARLPPRKTDFFLPKAFTEPLYLLLVGANFCLLIGMFVPMFFLPSYAISRGISENLATYLPAILNGASIPGRIIPGILADKLGRFNMLLAAGVSTGIVIFCWNRVTGVGGVVIYTIAFGFFSGAIISGGSTAIAMVPKDPKHIGTYLGQGMAVSALAMLMGPPATGAMLKRYGGYLEISMFAGAFTIFGAILMVLAKRAAGKGLWSIV